ncbi:MAG: sensor histidine kinase, partial [Clostridium sp.]|nr:sensor histidine kinase [Clostridium sp.]
MKINRDLSIKKLTLLIFLSIYIIFLIVTAVNLYSYSRYEFNKTEKLIKNFNLSLSTQITQKLDNIIDVSKYPLIIPDIEKLNTTLSNNNTYDIEQYNYLLYLCDMMLIQNKTINGAYIFNLNGNGVYTARNNNNDLLKNPFHEKWFNTAVDSSNQVEIFSNFNATNVFRDTTKNDESLIAITRKI